MTRAPSPDDATSTNHAPRLKDYESLAERVAAEMADAWNLGRRPRAEEYLARYPGLRSLPLAATRVIYEEICLREHAGEGPDAMELLNRFPQWSVELRMLLDCHRLLARDSRDSSAFPEVGERIGDYTIRMNMGSGGRGRVYLATQNSLAERPVVLKVTPRRGMEHLSLARLQHAHVVPLYSCQDVPERDLRILCMPYLGSVTLKQIIERFRAEGSAGFDGARILRVLDEARTEYNAFPAWSAVRQFLARTSHAKAVRWIGGCLAEALQAAHQRGLVHLDLKPSNVLLADDGQPMLLDFHLAQAPIELSDVFTQRFGATPAYAAPECLRAMEAIEGGRPVSERVDGGADIYSLGTVLFEALTGLPYDGGAAMSATSLQRLNPAVSLELARIIARCLAPERGQRYAQAADLAADLRGQPGSRSARVAQARAPGLAGSLWSRLWPRRTR